jgi:hypothetical protein
MLWGLIMQKYWAWHDLVIMLSSPVFQWPSENNVPRAGKPLQGPNTLGVVGAHRLAASTISNIRMNMDEHVFLILVVSSQKPRRLETKGTLRGSRVRWPVICSGDHFRPPASTCVNLHPEHDGPMDPIYDIVTLKVTIAKRNCFSRPPKKWGSMWNLGLHSLTRSLPSQETPPMTVMGPQNEHIPCISPRFLGVIVFTIR